MNSKSGYLKCMLSKGKTDDWSTPKYIYDYFKLHDFIDPCKLFELEEHNNLFTDFGDVPLFINPPYSQLKFWIEYAIFYHRIYKNKVILLIPVRADTIGFHLLLDYGTDFYFFRGRLCFGNSKTPFLQNNLRG